jgi:hypothetical protein
MENVLPTRSDMISSGNLQPLPTEFAAVAAKENGKVFVAWLNPEYSNHCKPASAAAWVHQRVVD